MAEPMRPVPRTATSLIVWLCFPRSRNSGRLGQATPDGVADRGRRGDGGLLERERGRQRDVRRRDAHDRRIEVVEALVGDDRRDLRAPAAQPRILLDREQRELVGAPSRGSCGVSSGTSERRSMTSAAIPSSAASCSAASRARGTIAASATTVRSLPCRRTRAVPSVVHDARRPAPRPSWSRAICARRRRPDRGRASPRPAGP